MNATKKLKVLISDTHNPWFNIATEDWIFRELDPSFETLYLWRNQKTVVVGRTQNPWTECNLTKMGQEGVSLARRVTGGGAVYHDLGNLIFTFLSPRESYSRSRNSQILISALKTFGINAEVSGRNDLIITFADGPRKMSGSAFRETKDRAFHHGTLLVNSDLEKLSQYLTPNMKKLESKGRASVRARVINLAEVQPVTPEALTAAIIEEFFRSYGSTCLIEHLDFEKLKLIPSLQERYEFFSNWDWRFGQSPEFQQVVSNYLTWGFFEVHIQSNDGAIQDCRIFSDTLFPDLIAPLQIALKGRRLFAGDIRMAIESAWLPYDSVLESPDEGTRKRYYQEFTDWLIREIEI